jgi:hypothetical protein
MRLKPFSEKHYNFLEKISKIDLITSVWEVVGWFSSVNGRPLAISKTRIMLKSFSVTFYKSYDKISKS